MKQRRRKWQGRSVCASASLTLAAGYLQKFYRTSSNLFSPRRRSEKERGLDSPRCSASSNNIAAGSKLTANPTAERHFIFFFLPQKGIPARRWLSLFQRCAEE